MPGERRASHIEISGGYFTGEWLNVEVCDGPDNTVWEFLERGAGLNFLMLTAAKLSGWGVGDLRHIIQNDGAFLPPAATPPCPVEARAIVRSLYDHHHDQVIASRRVPKAHDRQSSPRGEGVKWQDLHDKSILG